MKKVGFWLIVLFFLSGCSNSITHGGQTTTEGTSGSTPNTDPVCYLVQENSENLISVSIPNENNMSLEEIAFIQNFVQNKILIMTGERLYLTLSDKDVKKEQEYSKYSILMESQVTYNSDTHISIVFNGLLNRKKSAHPIHWLFSLNYNPQTLQIISFTEKYTVDNQLYRIFSELAEKMIKEECGGILPPGWDSFSEPICSEKDFLEGIIAEEEFCFYLQDTGVVISYPVPFALGDHKEVVIPYDKLREHEDDSVIP